MNFKQNEKTATILVLFTVFMKNNTTRKYCNMINFISKEFSFRHFHFLFADQLSIYFFLFLSLIPSFNIFFSLFHTYFIVVIHTQYCIRLWVSFLFQSIQMKKTLQSLLRIINRLWNANLFWLDCWNTKSNIY